MNDELGAALRRNWYVVGFCLLCMVTGSVAAVRSCGRTPAALGAGTSAASPSERMLRQALQSPPPSRISEQEEARAAIAKYREKLDAEPNSSETPALLSAMGNLFLQRLQDYDEAAQCYVRIVLDFPDWEGAYAIYPQLITCYERKGDQKNINWLCQLMMKRFPEDSQEYLFAKDQLGLCHAPGRRFPDYRACVFGAGSCSSRRRRISQYAPRSPARIASANTELSL